MSKAFNTRQLEDLLLNATLDGDFEDMDFDRLAEITAAVHVAPSVEKLSLDDIIFIQRVTEGMEGQKFDDLHAYAMGIEGILRGRFSKYM